MANRKSVYDEVVEKINEYNKKALLQVQNMIARQKRIIKN